LSKELPRKLQEAYYERMPEELRREWHTLDPHVQMAWLRALHTYHHATEEKLYEFMLELIKALHHAP